MAEQDLEGLRYQAKASELNMVSKNEASQRVMIRMPWLDL